MDEYSRHSRYNSSRRNGSSSGRDAQSYSRHSRGAQPGEGSDYSRYSRRTMGAAANNTSHYQEYREATPVDPRYSRENAVSRHKSKRQKGRKKKVGLTILIAVLLVVGIGAGAAFAYLQSISKNLHQGVSDDTLQALSDGKDIKYTGDAFYMLLLGTDGAWWRDEDPEFDGVYRTDSMLLVRVDPKDLKVSMISLQRDTLVTIPGYGQQKLNAAYTIGGAAETIKVVEDLCVDSAGAKIVDIDHYAEINFDGFSLVVDAIGGVEVDVPMEIDDPEAGTHIDAGLQVLDGDKALTLCRSRHTYDDYGKGDEYRAACQRMVLSAIAKKILKSDFPTMVAAIEAISENVATDFSVTDILSLANTLRAMDPDNDIYTAQMPTTSSYINETWYEILDGPEWINMLKRTNKGLPPVEESYVDEATGVTLSSSGGGTGASGTGTGDAEGSGKIAVRNGSMTEGAASAAAKTLEGLGYTTDASNAELHNYTTTLVVYGDSDLADEAAKVSSALGTGKTYQNDGTYTIPNGCKFLVVIGADYKIS